MDKTYTVIGLMSGTSLDGIDASIIRSDGEKLIEIKKNLYEPYDRNFKDSLNDYIKTINSIKNINNSHYKYRVLEQELTIKHSEISSKIIKENDNEEINFVGFHGQTIIHKPEEGYSIQMGDAKLLSQLLKKKVFFNFRKNDIKNNGNGAPLTPIFHYNLSKFLKIPEPNIILNIGGISNFTYINNNIVRAQDIGPGNVLMDEYLRKERKLDYDKDGVLAERGSVNYDIVNQFIEHVYYNSKNKHSFNRNDFDYSFIRDLNFEDAIATLTYFTANIIAKYINKNFEKNLSVIICGGGRKNKTLVNFIKKLSDKNIVLIDSYGVDGDFVESQTFGYLAIRSFLKKNISFPETTKVNQPVTGGELAVNFQ